MELCRIISFLYFKRELSELAKLQNIHSKKISYISGNGTF